MIDPFIFYIQFYFAFIVAALLMSLMWIILFSITKW